MEYEIIDMSGDRLCYTCAKRDCSHRTEDGSCSDWRAEWEQTPEEARAAIAQVAVDLHTYHAAQLESLGRYMVGTVTCGNCNGSGKTTRLFCCVYCGGTGEVDATASL